MNKPKKLKNLMNLFQEEEPVKKVQRILDKKQANGIKTVKFDKYTVNWNEHYFFLDCVPIIPNEYNVISKWTNYLPTWVNWNKEPDVTQDQLKKQYGFCVTLESKEKDKNTKRKDLVFCSMIFNNASTCEKHLAWFNSCFPEEPKEEESKKVPVKKGKK